MRRTFTAALSAIALVSASAGCAQLPSAQSDASAVRAWLAEYEASWLASDGERMFRTATDDVEWVNIVGMHWRGKEAVTQAHVAFLTTMFSNTPIKLLEVESVRPLGDDALVVVARWSVAQFTTPSGSVVPPSEDRMTLVLKRSAEGLRLAHAANIQIDQAAARSNPVKPGATAN